MRYVLQVYFDGAQERLAQLPETDREEIVREYVAFFQRPEIKDGNQLQAPATATTVRVQGDEIVRSAGTFSGSGEPLGGYYLIEVDDVDAAVALAARIPATRMGGAVEVRPVVER
jgi:hypothetical protein